MSKQSTSTLLGIIAGIIFLVGIVTSTSSLLRYQGIKRQYEKDIKYAKLLEDVENKFEQLELQTAPLKNLDYSNLPDPKELTKDIFADDKIEYIEQDKKELNTEYSINQIEISLKDISLEALPKFILKLESQRPPIRLTSCTITASTATSGTGNINLKLERIERP